MQYFKSKESAQTLSKTAKLTGESEAPLTSEECESEAPPTSRKRQREEDDEVECTQYVYIYIFMGQSLFACFSKVFLF